VLRKGGAVVTCGTTSGPLIEVNMARVFFLGLSILGSTMGSLGELHRVLALAGEGKLRPVIDSVLPWAEVAQGHERLGRREVAGKIVLELVGS
jgi:NADPH:quinone reductase-like Zn-dependent oxidoreductase